VGEQGGVRRGSSAKQAKTHEVIIRGQLHYEKWRSRKAKTNVKIKKRIAKFIKKKGDRPEERKVDARVRRSKRLTSLQEVKASHNEKKGESRNYSIVYKIEKK